MVTIWTCLGLSCYESQARSGYCFYLNLDLLYKYHGLGLVIGLCHSLDLLLPTGSGYWFVYQSGHARYHGLPKGTVCVTV